MTRAQYWLRWGAVLPCALLAGLFMTFPLHFMLYNTLKEFITPYPQTPERLLTPIAVGAGFVIFGARVAPDRKAQAALVLSALWMVLLAAATAFILLVGHVGDVQLSFEGGGAASFGALVGGVVGFLYARNEAGGIRKLHKLTFVLSVEQALRQLPDRPKDLPQPLSLFLIPLEYQKLDTIRCPKCQAHDWDTVVRASLAPRRGRDWPYSGPAGDEHQLICKQCRSAMTVTFWFAK